MAKPLLGATTLPANLLKQLFDTEYCHLLSISDLALVYRIEKEVLTMSIEENKKIAEADVQYLESGKVEEQLSYYDDNPTIWDSVIRVVKYSTSNTLFGFEEVKKFYTFLAGTGPIKANIQSVFGEDDKVAVEWTLSGGEGAQKFEIPCVNLYDFENGKIKNARLHFDSAYFAGLMKQAQ